MSSTPAASLRVAVLIPLAMALAVGAVSVVACVLRATGAVAANESVGRMLALGVLGVALATIPVQVVLRKVLLEGARAGRAQALELLRQGNAPPALLRLTIVSAALAEGVGLFGAVTVLVGGPWVVLAAPVLAVGWILLQLPTRARLEAQLRG